MLDRVKGKIVFRCDGDGQDACDEAVETGTNDFRQAKALLDCEDWRTFNKGPDRWGHRCPVCTRAWARGRHGHVEGMDDDDD